MLNICTIYKIECYAYNLILEGKKKNNVCEKEIIITMYTRDTIIIVCNLIAYGIVQHIMTAVTSTTLLIVEPFLKK